MKIRTGFVSNSSSSSFIVTFPRKPESKEELQSMMGDCNSQSYNSTHTSDEIVNVVWKDIQQFLNLSEEEILELNTPKVLLDSDETLEDTYDINRHISSIMEDIISDIPWEKREKGLGEIEALEKLIETLQSKINEAKNSSNKVDTFTVRLNYSDECGEGWLEHGNIFRNLPHEVISHH